MSETSTTTVSRRDVPEMGLLGKKAVIDHAIEHGLTDPEEVARARNGFVPVWLTDSPEDCEAWLETIYVDDTTTEPLAGGRERVRVIGRLPVQGIRVEIRFSRPATDVPRVHGVPSVGDRVVITRGMHSGRQGDVTYVARGIGGGYVVDVRVTVPVLIAEPDGPTRTEILPFAPVELEVRL